MAAAALLGAASATTAGAAELRGSPSSMVRQHEIAVEQDYSFLTTAEQVRRLVEQGRLEPVPGNDDYALSEVSFPYARAEVRLFVERLASQYRAATGERLVVTSLTRPQSAQPGNAHRLSVHPAGMAVDLRVPADSAARAWLERTLLQLEGSGVLDVTRERHPPHYHVAVFPAPYRAYVERREAAAAAAAAAAPTAAAAPPTPPAPAAPTQRAQPAAEPAPAPANPTGGPGAATLLFAGTLAGAAAVAGRRLHVSKRTADSAD